MCTSFFSHITRVLENEFEISKWRQVNQLKRLTAKTAPYVDNNIDLTGTLLKKWVVNVSKYKLNDDQTGALGKGINYAVTPDKLPVEDFVVATGQACRSLPIDKADQLIAQAPGVMKSAKLPKPNITKKERQALVKSRKEKSIMILPADKGKATVIMDTGEYEQKVKTYEKLNKDPTPKYKRKLVSIIKKLKEEDKITDEQYKYLYPTAENVPRMYCTPKIHKPVNPLRPIVDYTGFIGYNVSRSLADLLAPNVGTTTHNITNSKHLASEMACVMIEQDEMFLLHDVVSLFINTPIDDTLNIIRKRLEEASTLKLWKQLQVGDIMELLQFVVTTTHFSFRGTIYQQKF